MNHSDVINIRSLDRKNRITRLPGNIKARESLYPIVCDQVRHILLLEPFQSFLDIPEPFVDLSHVSETVPLVIEGFLDLLLLHEA